MTKYYVDITEELADSLRQVPEEGIIGALRELAENEASSGDLNAYDSVTEIEEDDSLTDAEERQLKLKAQRRSDISTR